MNIEFPSSIELIYLVAAAWRLANLFANEEGPWMVFARLRRWSKTTRNRTLRRLRFSTGLECEYCNSVWFGTGLTAGYILFGSPVLWLVLPLIISTGAILLKHLVFLLKSADTRLDQQNQRSNGFVHKHEAEEILYQKGD